MGHYAGFPRTIPRGGAGCIRVTHQCAGRHRECCHPHDAPRLACVKPVASVHPEPGSNSSLYIIVVSFFQKKKIESKRVVWSPARRTHAPQEKTRGTLACPLIYQVEKMELTQAPRTGLPCLACWLACLFFPVPIAIISRVSRSAAKKFGAKAGQNYNHFPNWQNFSTDFFQKNRTFSPQSVSMGQKQAQLKGDKRAKTANRHSIFAPSPKIHDSFISLLPHNHDSPVTRWRLLINTPY